MPPSKRKQTSNPATAMAPSKRQKPSQTVPDWAGLPSELLGLILQKLTVPDHIRLSCVCVSWNSAVKEKATYPKPQSPWLMLPGDESTSSKFLSFSENRTYNIPLPPPDIQQRVCVGSSHGWLITVYKMSKMHLLNPVTGVQVQLPSITTLPYVRCFLRAARRCFLHKAILSSAPNSDGSGDFAVILLHNYMRMPTNLPNMAITRVGDDTWTPLPNQEIVDVISHKGQLYAVDVAGFLQVWDLHDPSLETKTLTESYRWSYYTVKFLVQSVSGELFMLRKKRGEEESTGEMRTIMFEPFRFDVETQEFVSVDDMKDNVIFLGMNYSMAVSAMEFPELRGNCIYFTDDYYFCSNNLKHQRRDMGVFDISP